MFRPGLFEPNICKSITSRQWGQLNVNTYPLDSNLSSSQPYPAVKHGSRAILFQSTLSNLEECHILQVPVNHQCADLLRLCWILHEKQQLYQHKQMVERNNPTVTEMDTKIIIFSFRSHVTVSSTFQHFQRFRFFELLFLS